MRRISPLFVVGTLALFALASGIAHGQNPAPWTPPIPKGDITVELVPVVASGELSSPVMATHAGDGSGRLFIVDQPGQIRVVRGDGTLLDTPFLDLAASGDVVTVNTFFDERGLLGLAFHPDYAQNGRFFVRYSKERTGAASEPCFGSTRGCHEAIVAEFQVSSTNPDVADPSTQNIILRVDQPQFNHNSGHLAFGPPEGNTGGDDDDDDSSDDDNGRRFLYIGLGDGGGAHDGLADVPPSHGPVGNGLNTQTLLGSILRIDVDGGSPYGIPADNPFAGGGCANGCDEIYAYGLRNPYRFSFDRKDGRLFLGEVGQNLYEEINIVQKGANYGWVTVEGFHCFDPFNPTSPPSTCSSLGLDGEPLRNPIAEYSHDDGLSAIGGYVYRGSQSPALDGLYIFGDFSTSFFPGNGRLFWIDADNAPTDIFEFNIAPPNDPLQRYVFGFGEDEAGEVYVLTSQNLGPDPSVTTGEVFRIVAEGGNQGDDDDDSSDDDDDDFLSLFRSNDSGARNRGVDVQRKD